MSAGFDAPVLIVGAGPVGLTAAIDLTWRGIEVIVVERRHRGEPPNVKSNHVSARSMEIFRRLGVAGALRDAGLPPDYPNDVSYRTTATGMELARIPIPCRAQRSSHPAAARHASCSTPQPGQESRSRVLPLAILASRLPGVTEDERDANTCEDQDRSSFAEKDRGIGGSPGGRRATRGQEVSREASAPS